MKNLKKLFWDIEKKNDSYFYQWIKLVRYEAVEQSVDNHDEFTVASITDRMQNHFELSSSPFLKILFHFSMYFLGKRIKWFWVRWDQITKNTC